MRATKKDTCTLDKPRYELLRYDVHPNALTQSGNYHFSCKYDNLLYNNTFATLSITGKKNKLVKQT